MKSFALPAALLLCAAPALAQSPQPSATGARPGNEIGTGSSLPMSNRASNIVPGGPQVAPNLPSPRLAPGSSPRDFLVAARNALAAGRTGEAQQALEMAETRALDRSVPYGQTNVPDTAPFVVQIGDARRSLATGDRARTMSLIDRAIQTAGS